MSEIVELVDLDLKSLFISIFVILAAINGIVKIIGEFSKRAQKPFKWVQKQDAESIKVSELEQKVDKIVSEYKETDRKLEDKINTLTKIVSDDRVDRMRYEILDMASAISESKRWYSVEQLKHTLKVYDEYERFLKEHNLENGEVDLSIQIIKEAYRSKYNGIGNL